MIPTATQNPPKLSPRQVQLMRLLVLGLTNKQIGSAMGIPEQVVKNYNLKLFPKIGVENRLQAALWWLDCASSYEDEQVLL